MNYITRSKNRFCEYLLVVDIPEGEFLSFVTKLKKYIKGKYLIEQGTASYTHLTLIHFCMYEDWEGRLFRLLRKSVKFITSFHLKPGSFLNFSNETLVIDMKTENPIKEILDQIRKHNKDERTKLIKGWYKLAAQYSYHPHVTVAKDMDLFNLLLALEDLKLRYPILQGFDVTQLKLLKRPWGEETYEVAGLIVLSDSEDVGGDSQLTLF